MKPLYCIRLACEPKPNGRYYIIEAQKRSRSNRWYGPPVAVRRFQTVVAAMRWLERNHVRVTGSKLHG